MTIGKLRIGLKEKGLKADQDGYNSWHKQEMSKCWTLGIMEVKKVDRKWKNED